MQGRFFVDTNIFLYAFCQKNAAKQKIAKELVLSNAIISTQVINEVSANLLKKFGLQENSVMGFVRDCYRRYEVGNINEYVFSVASDIRSKTNYSYYDSMILASAIDTKCEILYSEDMQHNHVVGQGLTIVNPFV